MEKPPFFYASCDSSWKVFHGGWCGHAFIIIPFLERIRHPPNVVKENDSRSNMREWCVLSFKL